MPPLIDALVAKAAPSVPELISGDATRVMRFLCKRARCVSVRTSGRAARRETALARPRTVFITGASSGLGAALARQYARRARPSALFARRRAELDALAAALPPGRATVYEGDVRDADALLAAGSDFIARFGAPDIVIANAGISRGALTEHEEDLPTFRAVFDTNVVGLVHTFAPFVAAMSAPGAARSSASRASPGSAACRDRRVFGVEGRGHRISREPAHRAAGERRRGAHDLSRLHRNADDREESLSDAVPARRGRSRAAHRPRHRAPAGASTCCRGRWRSSGACCGYSRARSTTRCSRARREAAATRMSGHAIAPRAAARAALRAASASRR
mgnify:CR=1 FL=1